MKDTIYDMVQGSLEMSLFGERKSKRYSSRRGESGKTNYGSFSTSSSRSRDRDRPERREISRRDRSRHNFDDVILETRADAEEVIDNLVEMIDRYKQATVADLYDLVGMDEDFTDRKYGWENLSSASCSRARGGGYILNLPKPILLD